MKITKFNDVWDAIEDTPQDAANMRLRSHLMMALSERIKQQGWTQAEAATHLGVTQPRVSDLVRGKINLFAIDALVSMATSAGLQVEIGVKTAA